jgi:hypothetical protein
MPCSDVTGLPGDARDEDEHGSDADSGGKPDSDADPTEDPETSPARKRFLPAILIVLVSAAGLALLTALSQHAVPNNSDSSTVVLEGYAMVHGNPLLHNWSLSLDSFWTVDAPFYALGYVLVGLRPILVNFIPALLGVLVIVLGAVIARDGVRGRAAVVATSVVAIFLLLPSHALAYFLLQGPWHIGTALWCLLAFWGLRSGRFGWGWGVAVVLLAAGLLGDIQALVLGVLPIVGAGLIAIARTRAWRSGAAPISAAFAGIGLAEGIREIALRIGTFTFNESHHTAKAAQVTSNIGHLLRWGEALLGIDRGPYGGVHVPLVLELVHLIAAVCILACLVVAAVQLLHGAVLGKNRGDAGGAVWRLDDLLVLGIVGDGAVFEALTLSNNILYARYLTVGVIFSIILAARLLGRASTALPSGLPSRTAAAAAVVLAASFGSEVALELNAPVPAQPVTALDNFLLAHNLRAGVGDYWAASVVSVQSRGEIQIHPVVANLHKIIVPDGRQATASWYEKKDFQFLVYQNAPYGRVDAATVAGTFGTPENTFVIGTYHVAVWGHPITVTGPAFPSS